ncbi:MAG: ABC transporter ATP-binding protein [Bifidobacterium tibiigranuli]|jgi:NitT/TauT family transport system ATP-binding protein/taurine transport system ATP-binding protein|uniref:ABC transporter ATP-binding protein n=1 Tax=Bifidobacterium tibiigranuli TaxID=2172043 RepID=UPI002354EC03|nr:ABC transporter ATP-binding protein [Bifidobacterium tibiigranuli]MCH3975844.1 ABC transporter ATP-binding protein [Bifidobacterium tibiigranuli]MCH4190116.1 ABC transporter ATP-binding protein [Bifidobacterium tibiigranuli]MCH4203129.1 ABC transporter ATP-binding protein [Bifidobacterium tibiigranuli]MCH4274722.1 ABC transporter ATP-binding protein [Bifidobacterium tibiigranuli]
MSQPSQAGEPIPAADSVRNSSAAGANDTSSNDTASSDAAHTSSDTAIDIRHVSKRFHTQRGEDVTALRDINFTIRQHDFITVVGQSGCGKTTLLSMLAGFEHPTEGDILIDGEVVTKPASKRGVVFQKPQLYPWLSVKRNVEFGLRMQRVNAKRRARVADEYLNIVGLADAADRKPYELSGGMQQRAQIARVLAADPDVVLMDEPFGALDELTRENLQVELRRIWQDRRKTVFFITHSVEEAIFLGTRVIVLSSHPGTVLMDVPVDVPRGAGHPDDLEAVRSTEKFRELTIRIDAAIHQ